MLKNSDTSIFWTLLAVLSISVWIGIAPNWYAWYNAAGHCEWLKGLYNILTGNWWVNIPMCIVIGYCFFQWWKRIWKDNDICLLRLVLAIEGCFLLFYDCEVVYANIVWQLSYQEFLGILLGVSLGVMIVKIVKRKLYLQFIPCSKEQKEDQPENTNTYEKGFSDDRPNSSSTPESLKRYASAIADRLLKTNMKEGACVLGVTGEWGIGKTPFLELLEKKLSDSAEMVHFNPWMCRTPEQVTSDFFASLTHQLSPKYSTLSKSIREYAKYLNSISIDTVYSLRLNAVIPQPEVSLYERKIRLSDRFSKLPKPVVVFIDDLDRLERNEIFEVLRLIRNTADLKNTIYVVAYDKEYVTCVLEEKNIKDATSYLEKIFPIEINLPKVEDHLIWDVLKKDIEVQDSINGKFANALFRNLDNYDKELILGILNNYRRAKRFARTYMLTVEHIHSQYRGEIKYLDLFWLVLLQIYDKKIYDILASDSDCLLYRDKDRFRLLNGICSKASKEDKNIYTGKRIWRDATPQILNRIFGYYVKTTNLSICFTENYDKYFTLGVSKFRLSVKEVNELLNPDVDNEEVINKWFSSGKYYESINYQLQHINVNSLSDIMLKQFLQGTLYLGLKIIGSRYPSIGGLKTVLQGNKYNQRILGKAHDIAIEWLQAKMDASTNLSNISKLLKSLYVTTYYDSNGRTEKPLSLILSNSEIENLLRKVMTKFLALHPDITALSILNENSEAGIVFSNCCVMEVDAMECTGTFTYKQVVFEDVIEFFSKKNNKPDVKEYDKALGSMFNRDIPEFDDPDEEFEYWNYMEGERDERMQEFFGDRYYCKTGHLSEYKRKCFACSTLPAVIYTPDNIT